MAFAKQHSFRVFFSWQSDVKRVHSAISKELEKAAKKTLFRQIHGSMV